MDSELVAKVEAILFASGRFINAARIAEMLDCYQEDIQEAVNDLNESYRLQNSALHVVDDDGQYKLHVRDEFLELVSQIVSDTEVSGPTLETLAVIAWRSPCLQSDIIDIRGSNAYDHIKDLQERDFITRDPEGRTYRLRITEKFFEYFDIEGRDDIREVFKAVEEEHRKKEMELELEQRRLQQAIEAGDEAADEDEQESLPEKDVDIDDLDALLERSQKSREEMGSSLKEAAGEDEDDEDLDADVEIDDVEDAKKVREQVEDAADEIGK